MNKKPLILNSKYALLISMIYVAVSVTATAVAYKFVKLGPISVSGATIVFPINFFVNDVITEVYGYKLTRKVIWMGLICELFFAFFTKLVINLPSPSFWHLQNDYENVFGPTLRFVLSGIVADLVGMFSSAYLISKWKIFMKGKHFWLRSLGSTMISDFFMTIIIAVSAFAGKINLNELFMVLISGYSLHVLFAAVLIWPALFLALILKENENIDAYDEGINYNPFKTIW